MQFKIGVIAFVLFLLLPANCLEFKSTIPSSQVRCFFEILDANQKYKIDLYPLTGSTYDFSILRQNNETKNWQFEYSRQQVQVTEFLNVHKLASISSTYQFCVKNNDARKEMQYLINMASGLDLLELHLLPDNSDSENLALEMEWVKKQTQSLAKSLTNVNTLRSQTQLLSSVVGNNIVVGVIVFSVAAILVNGLFYSRMKKALNQRKMI